MIDLSGKKRLERSDNVCRAITGSVSVENVHPLQGGFFRPKDRRGRRPGMPIEPIWVFYLKYLWETCRRVCDTPRIGYGLTCIVGASRASSGWLPTLTKRLGLGVSEEKREPVSDIDAVAVDSLKVLDPKRPIREADVTRTSLNGRSWPISLKTSVSNFAINRPGHSKALDCETLVVSGWVRDWQRYQVRKLSEVLGGCCEKELIARAIRSSESESIELENAFEMGEQHFNFLAQSSRGAALHELAIWRAMSRAPS